MQMHGKFEGFPLCIVSRLQIRPLYIFGNKTTDGTKPDLNIGETRDCLWFRAKPTTLLGGGFKYVLFSPLFGEDYQFD